MRSSAEPCAEASMNDKRGSPRTLGEVKKLFQSILRAFVPELPREREAFGSR